MHGVHPARVARNQFPVLCLLNRLYRLLVAAGIAVILLLVALTYFVYLSRQLSAANRLEVQLREKAEKAEKDAEKAADSERDARAKAEKAEKDAEKASDDYKEKLEQAQRNATLTNEKQTELEELARLLSGVTVLPSQAKSILNKYSPQTARVDSEFNGVQAEIFVSAEHPDFVTKAQKFVKALQQKGIEFPVPQPQPRKHVADPKSEVRYYYKGVGYSDEALGKKVMELLIHAGIPPNKITTSYVDDKTAPQKFIQVSLANNAFTGS